MGGEDPTWYENGLRFECQADCGACCTSHGNYAYVYLAGDDVDRLVGQLGIDEEDFLARFTDLDDGHLVLRMDSSDCPFLDGTRCGVYPARPTQCSTFPFWHESLKNPQNWRRLKRFCPGIDEGPRHSLATIRVKLAERPPDD